MSTYCTPIVSILFTDYQVTELLGTDTQVTQYLLFTDCSVAYCILTVY